MKGRRTRTATNAMTSTDTGHSMVVILRMMRSTTAIFATLCFLTGAAVHAQIPAAGTPVASEEIEPRVIGTTGTMTIGLAGYVDRFFSSERNLATHYTANVDVGRFVARRIVVRGGLTGTGQFGGDGSDDPPTGAGAAALHAFAGVLYYFTPQSMLSAYAGGEYWNQLTQRADADPGATVGTFGLQGAMSSRASVFIEGAYGLGLAKGDEGETMRRVVGRLGIRLKF